MNKKIVVMQNGYKECGAACLASIIKYYGGNIPLAKITELTNTNKNGTTFYDLKQASLKIGLDVKSFKIDESEFINNLDEIKMPSVCQVICNNYEHFVVLYKINNKRLVIMDPAKGIIKMKIDEFLEFFTGYIMMFSNNKKLPRILHSRYLEKIIIDVFCKNKGIVINIICLSIIFTIVSCVFAMYSGIVIDNILPSGRDSLYAITLIFGILLLIKCLAAFFRNTLFIILNQKLDCSLFIKSFQKVLLLPYSYYKNRTTGEVISRINDLVYVKNLLNKIILTVCLDIIVSIGCAIWLLKINKYMFLMLLITIVLYIFIYKVFRKILKYYTNICQEDNASVNSYMIEVVNGFETVKNLNMESGIMDKMASLYAKSLNDLFNFDNLNNLEMFIKDIVTYSCIMLSSFVGFSLVFDNILSIGEIITFIALTDYFISPIRNVIDLNKEYFYAVNSLRRASDLLDQESYSLDCTTNFSLGGKIDIVNLSYSYNDYRKAIGCINLSINPGDKILLLGSSGSGKSTLIKLLSKYYQPCRGMIYYDNVDVNDISLVNIKNFVTTISQEEIIFTDTIRNNILMGRCIDSKLFMDICQMTGVDDFVRDMFLGYDTRLEENGQNISGGQRQRIILARALLKKSKIILIDEGLSAIDSSLEKVILERIFKEYRDKTIIIVSHRLENMNLYDRVLKLNNGKIYDLISRLEENKYV